MIGVFIPLIPSLFLNNIFEIIIHIIYPIIVPNVFAIRSSISVALVVINCDYSIINEKQNPNNLVFYIFL